MRCARHHVGDEPFAVLLGDTLMTSRTPVTGQLMKTFDRYQESVVALQRVPETMISRYGVMKGEEIRDDVFLVQDFVEKPSPEEAPSDLAIAGRYVFTPDIFTYLEATKRGKNNEVQLTDAMRAMVADRAMYGLRFEGKRYDIGNKLDFIKTNLTLGLQRRDMRDELKAFVKDLAKGL